MAPKFACLAALVVASSALLAACSGAESTELFDQPVTDNGATLPAPSPSPGTPTPSPGTNPDPNPEPPKKDEPPKGTCAAEVEPNNNRNNPNLFTSCVSGKLATATDVDNLVVKAPTIAKSMVIKSSGTGGRIQFSVNGGNFLLGVNETWTEDDEAPTVPVVPDETYSFQVRTGSNSGGERAWKLEVVFE
jgi:hypothetical protein